VTLPGHARNGPSPDVIYIMSTPERFEFRSDDGLSIAYVKGETAATFVESFKSLTDFNLSFSEMCGLKTLRKK
jgi:hypothetical protein